MTTLIRVWWFLLLSMLGFALLLNTVIMGRPNQQVIMLHVKIMGIALGGLSLGLFIFAFFIRQVMIRSHLKQSPLAADSSPEAHLDKIYLASILQWALFSGIGIYGFVVANIGNRLLYGLPFLALACLGFGLTYPQSARMIKIVKRTAQKMSR